MRVRNLRALIDQLEDLAQEFGDDAEVRLAFQPRWPLEFSIAEPVGVRARTREALPACIYLGESSALGYLEDRGARALGWSGGEPDEDDEDDEPMPGRAGGSGPDFDTRDREGREPFCDACQQHRPCSCDEPKGAK